jgi:predicted esterase
LIATLAVSGFSDGASYALSIGPANGDLFTHVMAFSPGFADLTIAPISQSARDSGTLVQCVHQNRLNGLRQSRAPDGRYSDLSWSCLLAHAASHGNF